MAKNSKVQITIPKDFLNELQNYGNMIARNLALTFKEELVKEYQRSVALFYDSYTPKRYVRHEEKGGSGFRNSYRPYYRNPHGTRFHGGVEITASKMDHDYHDSPEQVISSAIAGYHGRPNRGIYTAPEIYEHMMKYRELLFANAESFVGGAVAKSSGQYGKYNL